MNEAIHFRRMSELDEPWRRFPGVLAVALCLWFAMLYAFSLMLHNFEHRTPPAPIEAELIEMPLAGGGGGGGSAAAGANGNLAVPANPAAAKEILTPVVKHSVVKPRHDAPVHPTRAKRRAPVLPPDEDAVQTAKALPPPIVQKPALTRSGTASPANASSARSAEAAGSATSGGGGRAAAGSRGGTGQGSSGLGPGGIGSSSTGAQAIYAPMPSIPEDLREDALETAVVARFDVSAKGDTKVVLVEPTQNPRLNSVVLETLKQWKFRPAVRNGQMAASSALLRITISVE